VFRGYKHYVLSRLAHFKTKPAFDTSGLDLTSANGIFLGWVAHPDIFCWVSFLYPTYLPAIFVLSAKPNKLAKDINIPETSNIIIFLKNGRS
jgi:hypothetical protein